MCFEALEEATKSRAELQQAMSKIKAELSEREERLRQRDDLSFLKGWEGFSFHFCEVVKSYYFKHYVSFPNY